jgi:hypothetical protein
MVAADTAAIVETTRQPPTFVRTFISYTGFNIIYIGLYGICAPVVFVSATKSLNEFIWGVLYELDILMTGGWFVHSNIFGYEKEQKGSIATPWGRHHYWCIYILSFNCPYDMSTFLLFQFCSSVNAQSR